MKWFTRKSLSVVNSGRGPDGGPSFEGRYGGVCKSMNSEDFYLCLGHLFRAEKQFRQRMNGVTQRSTEESSRSYIGLTVFSNPMVTEPNSLGHEKSV